MTFFLRDVTRSIGSNIYLAPSTPGLFLIVSSFLCSFLFSGDAAALDRNVIADSPVSDVTV